MTLAYVGLGSNLDKPIKQVKDAFASLEIIKKTKLIKKSSLYKTKPVGGVTQDDFINAAALVDTELTALDLLQELQNIENNHQRVRKIRWGPRTLDLDLLLYGDELIDLPNLKVPHIEILNRDFVLIPLSEISPDLLIPQTRKPISKLANFKNKNIFLLESN